ncbi:hypothetical protein CDEST_07921 [Colletotrichum destructivum]|uniref:Uncharacterized protein n=1 Tax=Colletotrichum destructivum TaxID=34406 RepID=A0AAX4IHZ6_9PEZI|nr:hypothetical protein CDEST_07921 [Colletotrichum destructivum]
MASPRNLSVSIVNPGPEHIAVTQRTAPSLAPSKLPTLPYCSVLLRSLPTDMGNSGVHSHWSMLYPSGPNSSSSYSSNSRSRRSSSHGSSFSLPPITCHPVPSSSLPRTQFKPRRPYYYYYYYHHHHLHQQQQQQQQHLSLPPQTEAAGHLCIRTGAMAEATEPTMDCNLPELLAQDLEFSSLIFAAKNMTAGAPPPALASDEDDWQSTAEPPTVLGASCHPNAVPQFQPLGAIDEKSSGSGASEHDISDNASSSSGDSFSMAGNDVDVDGDDHDDDEAAESPHIRQQSVMTAGTTISASSQPATVAPSQKRVVSFGGEYEGSFDSWMDFEPDAPVDYPELGKSLAQSPVTTPVKPARPLSRLGDRSINESSPRRAKSANAAATTRRLSNPFEGYTRPASRARSMYSYPMTEAAKEQNRHSIHSLHSLTSLDMAVPTRSSSLKHRVSFTDDARKAISSRSRSRSHASSTNVPDPVAVQGTNRSSVISDLKEELEPWFRYLDAQDEQPPGLSAGLAPPLLVTPRPASRSSASRIVTPTPRPRSQAQARSRPTSSLSTSYTWLEDPIDIPPPPSDDQSRRIPLPPNVMESLRVSVTCFPETMLLCSSLSIETIRSYSRKVRQPPLEALRPDTPPTSPKRWRWFSSRRTSNLANGGRRCCSRGSSSNLDLPSTMPPSTVTLTPPQWSRIRSVFPHGSDYLCDALYAHIVAYNYLAPMVHNPPPGGAGRPPTPGSPASTEDTIPKKAATLLGLQGCQETTTPKPLRKRSSMFLGLRSSSWQSTFAAPPSSVPTTPLTAAPLPPASDIPLRDLQHGLHRCIARLVTTLRAEGSEGPIAGEPVNDVDPLVMRSLCEIVKCCEESPTNDRSL